MASAESFNLIFEASVGTRGSGDIAIDSITYSKGACPSEWGSGNFVLCRDSLLENFCFLDKKSHFVSSSGLFLSSLLLLCLNHGQAFIPDY